MPTIPDHDRQHHDDAPPLRPVPVPAQDVTLLALVKRFSPDGWEIDNPHGEFWQAIRRRGSEQRIIAANSVITLYSRLARIASDEAQQPPGIYPDPVAAYLAYLDDLGRVWTGQRCLPATAD